MPAYTREAAEIRGGDTGYIANNSIWFTNESDLSVWKRVRAAFAPKDVKAYQQIILEERQAWQFSGPTKVKVISYWANQHEINVKMLTEGRLADSEWWVEDKDYANAAARTLASASGVDQIADQFCLNQFIPQRPML